MTWEEREQLNARQNIEAQLEAKQPASSTLLHSRATLFAVMQSILAERPNRFARDPRRFSSLPRVRE